MIKLLFLSYHNGYSYSYDGSSSVPEESTPSYSNKPFGLLNSSAFLRDFLQEQGVESAVEMCDSTNQIHQYIVQHSPTHIVLEALWVDPLKMEELLTTHPTRTFIIRIHSHFAFLAKYGHVFKWLSAYKRLIRDFGSRLVISGNNEQFSFYLEDALQTDILYLPNVYFVEYLRGFKAYDISKNTLHIGCFGAFRELKNHLAQAIAAISVANNLGKFLHFHVNVPEDPVGQNIFLNLQYLFQEQPDHHLISHPWQEHPEFLETVATMDLNYQLSFSETFNFTSADSIVAGIPVLTSSAIEWLTPFKADTQNILDMFAKTIQILSDQQLALDGWTTQRDELSLYNKIAANHWLEYLGLDFRYQVGILVNRRRSGYIHYDREVDAEIIFE